ncbi:Alpha beta hydrolase [Seminavis robusta]|uniref:Alpha beta hydrolase n=1 Tax=Seminavis robusta TaxID=568900 RepID=A0A9N8ENE6_9STRA|nr:Alpha beta hydrolase [Seminavis robusta]|eukprot:Sro1386_g268310.1 Alpha beta hydrolase (391) ;mRNA; f:21753-22925
MTVQELQSKQQSKEDVLDRPILITNAMDPSICEEICDKWMETVGDEQITVQRQHDHTTTLYDCTVQESLDWIMLKSKPGDAFFAFVEGLLDQGRLRQGALKDRLVAARENVFSPTDGENWFDYFPNPPTDCIVLAGEGATSTLHRDPFEWTGTSLCLEGRKLWRFLQPHEAPGHVLDHLQWDHYLDSYRLNSMAWKKGDNNGGHDDRKDHDEDAITISAGWQSDLSLYNDNDGDSSPHAAKTRFSARQLAEMTESQAEEFLQDMVRSTNYLAPHDDIGKILREQPSPSAVVAVVQHPGELLIIPPYWYHQTYAPEPSLAVASQRCGTRLDAARVVNHILSLQQEPKPTATDPSWREQLIESLLMGKNIDPKTTVDQIFQHIGATTSRHKQ